MVALGLKDGVEVDAGDPKFFQIVQLLHDTAQIPSEEIIRNDLLRVRILEIHGIIRPIRADDRALLLYDHIPRTRKTVGEDLVHDGVLEPVGRMRTLVIDRDLIGCRCLHAEGSNTAQHLCIVSVKIRAALGRNDKVIPDKTAILRKVDPAGIEFLLFLRISCLQGNQTLPRLILPQAHKHPMNRLVGTNADTKTQAAPCLRCSDDGAVVYIL